MARYVASPHRAVASRRLIAVHIGSDEVDAVCATPRPSAALAALIQSLADTDLAAPVIKAVSSRTAWRLRAKNRRHGGRGLTISFAVDTAIATPHRLVAYALASTRIRPSETLAE